MGGHAVGQPPTWHRGGMWLSIDDAGVNYSPDVTYQGVPLPPLPYRVVVVISGAPEGGGRKIWSISSAGNFITDIIQEPGTPVETVATQVLMVVG